MRLLIFDYTVDIEYQDSSIVGFLKQSFVSSKSEAIVKFVECSNINEGLFTEKCIYKTGNFYISSEQILIDISNVCKLFIDFNKKIVYYHTKNCHPNLFINEILLSSMILLGFNITVIHGSTISYNKKTSIFTGWGGSGKTSISSMVYKKYGGKFIADDITIISKNQRVLYNPSLLNIFKYNKYESEYFQDLHLKEESLFYDVNSIYSRTESESTITNLYFLQKWNLDTCKIIKLENNDIKKISYMMFSIVLHEIKVLQYVKRTLDCTSLHPNKSIFLESINRQLKNIIHICQTIQIYTVHIPYGIDSNKMSIFIDKGEI